MTSGFDLVLQNGRLLDPQRNLDGIYSIGINGGDIAAISKQPLTGAQSVNAAGHLITPGLIDFHTHLFDGGSHYGIRPDLLLSQGVTSAVDAGTSGSAGFEAFYRSVIATSAVTVKAFISLGATGLSDPNHHQSYQADKINQKRLAELVARYPDIILGLKVSMSRSDVGMLGLAPLESAVGLARELGGLRVCVHSTDPPCDSAALLSRLVPGDILCHCYHATGPGILNQHGRVKPEYWEARARGILFDVANGIGHFSHNSAQRALDDGFLPDIVSSDMVRFAYGLSRRNRSLPYVMSKLLSMGMPLPQLIRATTEIPARLMGLGGRIGTLAVGAQADLCIFSLEPCSVRYEDAKQEYFKGDTLLCPQMTIKQGQIVFFQNKFNL